MATESRRVMLSYEDLLEMPDDRNRYEIIDGQLQTTPAPTPDHQRVVLNLGGTLNVHARTNGLGTVFVAPCDVFLSDFNVVEPDIFFVAASRDELIETRLIRGAPNLVIEVLSPSTSRRDRMGKRQLYAQFGVDDYWIINPVSRTMEIYILENGAYELGEVLDSTGILRPRLFPDLEIRVAEIWD
jgi:Uma2 family endonuclease